jgi:hypothetical protein
MTLREEKGYAADERNAADDAWEGIYSSHNRSCAGAIGDVGVRPKEKDQLNAQQEHAEDDKSNSVEASKLHSGAPLAQTEKS